MTFFHGGRRRPSFATLSETSYCVGITRRGGRRFRIVASFSGMGKRLETVDGTTTRLHRWLRRSRHLGRACGAQMPSLSFGAPPKNASRAPAPSSSSWPSLPPSTDITTDQIGAVDKVGLADGVQEGRGWVGADGGIGTGDPTAEAGGDGVLVLAVLQCCGPSPSLSARSWLQCSVILSKRSSLISWWRTGLCCTRRQRIAMVPPFVDDGGLGFCVDFHFTGREIPDQKTGAPPGQCWLRVSFLKVVSIDTSVTLLVTVCAWVGGC